MLIFENRSSEAEQKTTVACYQTCYTNSTEGTVHGTTCIWKNQQPLTCTVFLHDGKNRVSARHYARYRSNTNNKLTFFQKVLVFSGDKQSSEPCPIVLFGILLFRLDTNSSHAHSWQYRVQRSLAVEVLDRWMVYKDHASVSYVQFTGRRTHSRGYDNDIVTEHDVESHDTSLAVYGYANFC